MARARWQPGGAPAAMPARAAPLALGWGAVLFALQVAAWPALEQPGRALREFLLPVLFLVAAWSFFRTRERLALPVVPALLVAGPLAAILLGVLRVPAAERPEVLYAGALLATTWLAGLALCSVTTAWPELGESVDDALGWAAVGALVVVSAFGLAEGWFGWQVFPVVRPPAGPFLNRNVAGQALVILVPLAAAAAARTARPPARWVAVIAAALGLAFLLATRSRGAWLAAALGWGLAIVLAAWRHRSDLRERARSAALPAVVLAAGAGLGALVPVGGAEPLPSAARAVELVVEGEGRSSAVRQALWANTAQIVADSPLLGAGAGRLSAVYPLYHQAVRPTPGFGLERSPDHAHNDLLETAAELGLPAALCLAALLFGGLYRSRAGSDVAIARAAAIAGVLVHSLVSFPLHAPASATAVFLLVGRAWAGSAPRVEREAAAARGLGIVRAALAAAFGIALLVAGAGELRAQRALGQAVALHAAGDCSGALDGALRAAEVGFRRRTLSLAAAIAFDCEKDPKRSLSVIEPALAVHPHQLNLLLNGGARRLKASRAREAEEAFRHALEISPGLSRGWLGLAMSLDRRGEWEAARDACRRAVERGDLPAARAFCEGNGYLRPSRME